jgi:hypothetical protein
MSILASDEIRGTTNFWKIIVAYWNDPTYAYLDDVESKG